MAILSCPEDNGTLDILSYIAFGLFLEWGLIHLAAFAVMLPPAMKGKMKELNAVSMSKLPQSTQWKHYESLQAQGTAIEDNDMGVPVFSTRQGLQLAIMLGSAGASSILAGVLTAWFPSRQMWWVALPALTGDIGYWVVVDLIDAGNPVAEAQTYIISTAMIICAIKTKECYDDVAMWELAYMIVFPGILFLGALVVKLLYVTRTWKCPLNFDAGNKKVSGETTE
jgi:hypothetical protein